jgi:hypothetical protein
MAKFTPGLMGVKTTPTLGKNSIPGFIDTGMASVDNSIRTNLAITAKNKATKFAQAQKLRDGIVSGHFSEDMVVQVEAAIDRMSKLNPNRSNYSKVLNEANAELGMAVQKQAKVTDLLARTSEAFEGDEDKKYYSKDGFFAMLEDNTNIDLDKGQMQNLYQGYLQNTENINQDVVREDFVTLLGKYKFGGDLKTKEGEIGGLATMKTGNYQGEKTQMYKLENGISVPVFQNSSEVPQDLVEKWGTSSKAHMAMLDNYTKEKMKGFQGTQSEIDAEEMRHGQEFVLDQMKKVIPDYASVSSATEKFQPGQGDGDGSGTDPNPSALIATQLSRSMLGSDAIIGKSPLTEMQYQNTTLSGYDITNQFKDIKLIPGIGKSPGRPAKKIFRAENEDALYIDTGNGIQRYDESQFNDLMIMASSAGNGFTMKDANSLPEYDNIRKGFNIRQTVTDGTTTKLMTELTDAERKSGNWSPSNQSLTGTDFNPYQNTLTQEERDAQKVRAEQQSAGSALNMIDDFNFDMMDDSNENYEMVTSMADALNTSWAGKNIKAIHPTKTISSIQRGVAAVGQVETNLLYDLMMVLM